MRQAGLPLRPHEALPTTRLIHGDCLDVMPTLAASSVQLVFADLPYGCTNLSWDCPIDAASLWVEAWRVGHAGVNVVLTATQPFATHLIMSQMAAFQYETIWRRVKATNPFSAKRKPMRAHENILTFFRNRRVYNPQKHLGTPCKASAPAHSKLYITSSYKTARGVIRENITGMHNPVSVQHFDESDILRGKKCERMHPTQKPVALLEWLIRTYTNEGDTVLDPVFGSCTTGVACLRTGRNFIGIEKDSEYFRIGSERVAAERARLESM